MGEDEDGTSLCPQPHRLLLEKLADGVAQLALRLDANLDSAMQKRADAGYGLEVCICLPMKLHVFYLFQ